MQNNQVKNNNKNSKKQKEEIFVEEINVEQQEQVEQAQVEQAQVEQEEIKVDNKKKVNNKKSDNNNVSDLAKQVKKNKVKATIDKATEDNKVTKEKKTAVKKEKKPKSDAAPKDNVAPTKEKVICKGTTKVGAPCKKFACDENGFCKVHSSTQELFSSKGLLEHYDMEEEQCKKIMMGLERFTKDVLEKVQPTTKAINRQAINQVVKVDLGLEWLEGIKGESNYAFTTLNKILNGPITKLNSKMNQLRSQKYPLGKEAKEELIAYLAKILQRSMVEEDIFQNDEMNVKYFN